MRSSIAALRPPRRASGVLLRVTTDNLDEILEAGVVAHEDARRTRWALGPYAAMQTRTIGRAASSRRVMDAKPRAVTIEVSLRRPLPAKNA
jgi:hypothetical protein